MEMSLLSSIVSGFSHVQYPSLSLSTSNSTGDDSTVQTLKLGVGLIGNVVSLLLYATPIFTFIRVIKKRSTEEFLCIPYVTAFLNCLIYSWYGSPVCSHGWENLPLVTINGFGVFLELSFLTIYFWFSRSKKTVTLILTPVFMFCIAMIAMTLAIQDRALRKALVGSFGFVASIAMYGSPLVAVKLVIQTKSVEFMPFYLSFFSFLTTLLWLIYGLLSFDLLLASPNLLGVPLGILQLVLYCIYRNKGDHLEKPCKDIERGDDSDLTSPLISETEINN